MLDAYHKQGYAGFLRVKLEQIRELQRYNPMVGEAAATAYIELGDNNRAIEALEMGYEDGAPGLIYLKVNPLYEPLRSDPRFQNLERREGLLAH